MMLSWFLGLTGCSIKEPFHAIFNPSRLAKAERYLIAAYFFLK
jgi:hypothetical protein